MIRILHCIGSLGYGGSQAFVMEVYRKIDRTRIQFDFVVFPEEVEGFYSEAESLGSRIHVCPRYNGRNHFEFVKWWKRFLDAHPEYRIVHGHVRSVAILYLSAASQKGLITIAHSHSTSNGTGIASVVKAVMQFPLRYRADYLLACSDKAGKWLFGNRAVRKANYRTIPNCIDCGRFSFDSQSRARTRKLLKLGEDDFVIGHIGRFYAPKNHPFLLKVFRAIRERCENARLILIGDGEGRPQAERMVREWGMEASVRFVGIQNRPEDFYQAMDVFVFPSLWEGLPLSVVEAQAAGLPCVISDTITREVCLTGLVETVSLEKSADAWAERILERAQGTDRKLSAADADALMRFDSRRIAGALEDFYHRIALE